MALVSAICWPATAGVFADGALAPRVASTEPTTEPKLDREYLVKAAALFHFIRYTTWPAESFENKRSPIVVEVVGEDPFGKHLEAALADKVVDGRAIVLKRTKEVPEELSGHLVFEGRLKEDERAKLLALCRGRPHFLFGDRPGFAEAGACGGFYLEESKVRFEINVDAVDAAGLEVSSQLLKLARIVRDEGEGK